MDAAKTLSPLPLAVSNNKINVASIFFLYLMVKREGSLCSEEVGCSDVSEGSAGDSGEMCRGVQGGGGAKPGISFLFAVVMDRLAGVLVDFNVYRQHL